MNKSDLIEKLKTEAGITKSEATVVVNLFFDEMADALANGDRAEIRGLCSFYLKKYKGYTGLSFHSACFAAPQHNRLKTHRMFIAFSLALQPRFLPA